LSPYFVSSAATHLGIRSSKNAGASSSKRAPLGVGSRSPFFPSGVGARALIALDVADRPLLRRHELDVSPREQDEVRTGRIDGARDRLEVWISRRLRELARGLDGPELDALGDAVARPERTRAAEAHQYRSASISLPNFTFGSFGLRARFASGRS
jgi:hypothetical protein